MCSLLQLRSDFLFSEHLCQDMKIVLKDDGRNTNMLVYEFKRPVDCLQWRCGYVAANLEELATKENIRIFFVRFSNAGNPCLLKPGMFGHVSRRIEQIKRVDKHALMAIKLSMVKIILNGVLWAIDRALDSASSSPSIRSIPALPCLFGS